MYTKIRPQVYYWQLCQQPFYYLSEKPVEPSNAETVETSQNEISAENSAQPEEQKIIDKNLKLEVPYVL